MFRMLLLSVVACCACAVGGKTLHVYVLTGQSNSLGAVKGSPADSAKLRPEPQRVLFWQANFGGYCRAVPPHVPQWEKVRPQRASKDDVMGLEYGFAQTLERLNPWPGDDVAIVKASRDGGGNRHWCVGGDAYAAVTNAVASAVTALPKGAYDRVRFEALLYLQGESDAGAEIVQAAERFESLFKNLRGAFGALPGADVSGMKAVIGEPANWFGKDASVQGVTTRDGLKTLAEGRPEIGWVPTRDQPKISKGDNMGVHYNGNAQLVIGGRFAEEALRLAGKANGRRSRR